MELIKDTKVFSPPAKRQDSFSELKFITGLAALVTQASEKQKLRVNNQRLRAQVERQKVMPEIIVESPQLKEILRLVHRVFRSETSVLITGESGTGKELIAQALHRLSPRANETFVDLNCAT